MADPSEEACILTTYFCASCYVYQVPPARTSAGHRAQDWNVDEWLQEVAMRVVEQGDTCTVRLEDKATGELFAACPVPYDKPLVSAVEPVVDSSRYFVLLVVDTTGQATTSASAPAHAFVGLGLAERSQAVEFNLVLQDYVRRMERQQEAHRRRDSGARLAQGTMELHVNGDNPSPEATAKTNCFALKEGQTITINLKSQSRSSEPSQSPNTKPSATAASLLPPPPRKAVPVALSPPSLAPLKLSSPAAAASFPPAPPASPAYPPPRVPTSQDDGFDDDDFGDFVAA